MEVLSKEMILLTNVEVQLALENTPALAKFPPIEEFMHVIEERKSESDIGMFYIVPNTTQHFVPLSISLYKFRTILFN